VVFPSLPSGIEETDNSPREWIDRRKIGPLGFVAAVTGEGKVAELVFSAVLTRNDVLDLMS
jgi:hypothetical protein